MIYKSIVFDKKRERVKVKYSDPESFKGFVEEEWNETSDKITRGQMTFQDLEKDFIKKHLRGEVKLEIPKYKRAISKAKFSKELGGGISEFEFIEKIYHLIGDITKGSYYIGIESSEGFVGFYEKKTKKSFSVIKVKNEDDFIPKGSRNFHYLEDAFEVFWELKDKYTVRIYESDKVEDFLHKETVLERLKKAKSKDFEILGFQIPFYNLYINDKKDQLLIAEDIVYGSISDFDTVDTIIEKIKRKKHYLNLGQIKEVERD